MREDQYHQISDIERDLNEFWSNFRVEPKYIQITMEGLRKMRTERDDLKDYVIEFLDANKDIPGDVIAVLQPGSVVLLVDEDGNLLSFA